MIAPLVATSAADAAVAIAVIATIGIVVSLVLWQLLGIARAKAARDWDRGLNR